MLSTMLRRLRPRRPSCPAAKRAALRPRLEGLEGLALLTLTAVDLPAAMTTFPVAFKGAEYFALNDGVHGEELWKSDGTAAGTGLVADLNAGANGSTPRNLTVSSDGNTLYFTANDGSHGIELWRTDGTAAALVADVAPGFAGSSPSDLTPFGSGLLFSAYKPGSGVELWRTDGTAAGTAMVADIAAGPYSSLPANLTVVGTEAFFTATDGPTATSCGRPTAPPPGPPWWPTSTRAPPGPTRWG